jgi:uncharacterized membrane protein YgdD (TMEM256/DUF423 family)
MRERHWVALAAGFGFVAVAFGAFAAHGFDAAGDERAARLVETGSRYQLLHAVAMLAAVAWVRERPPAVAWWAVGTLLFPCSLYALALGAPPAVATLAPVGGGALLLGWAALAWHALKGVR